MYGPQPETIARNNNRLLDLLKSIPRVKRAYAVYFLEIAGDPSAIALFEDPFE
jgi:hypothetical protein